MGVIKEQSADVYASINTICVSQIPLQTMKLSFLCSLLLLVLRVNAQKMGEYHNLGFDHLNECSWD